jgi:penicillin-binding protein 1A
LDPSPHPDRTSEPARARRGDRAPRSGAASAWAFARRPLAALTLLAVAAGLGLLAWVVRDLPSLEPLVHYRPVLPSVVVDREGRPVAEFFLQRRRLTALGEIPPRVVQAFLASEDAGFYDHPGIDLGALVRASLANLRAGGAVRQGGSTITQQLAKNLLLSPERTLLRKLRDIVLALRIERALEKDRILEIYLNDVYLGRGAYGVAQAARSYFGRELGTLSVSEAALLAGLTAAPTRYSPARNPEAAELRRRWVLERMGRLGHLTEEEVSAAIADPPRLIAQLPPAVEPVAVAFVEEVRRQVFERLGEEAVRRGGLRIETTLDLDLQRRAVEALRSGLERLESRRRGPGGPASDAPAGGIPTSASPGIENGPPSIQGALAAVEVPTGEVLALVGGYDFREGQFNRATQARRQPGSAFKPFVYGAALEAGFPTNGTVYDYQVETWSSRLRRWWRPKNVGGVLRGPVPIHEAFARSLNNATIRLLDDVGTERVVSFARRAGIVSPLAEDRSLALGTSEVSPLELTAAYATFARGGERLPPHLVRRILDRDGRPVALDPSVGTAQPASGSGAEPRSAEAAAAVDGRVSAGISPVDAYLLTHLMRGTVTRAYGTAHSAARLDAPIAGKTGSTNRNRDAWFVGYSPRVAAGVWIGHDSPTQELRRSETGARAALPIWIDFMRAAIARLPDEDGFDVPSGVHFVWTDPESSALQRSERPVAWGDPMATGRKPRRSSYVAPPRPPEPEPEPAFPPLGSPLPTFGSFRVIDAPGPPPAAVE